MNVLELFTSDPDVAADLLVAEIHKHPCLTEVMKTTFTSNWELHLPRLFFRQTIYSVSNTTEEPTNRSGTWYRSWPFVNPRDYRCLQPTPNNLCATLTQTESLVGKYHYDYTQCQETPFEGEIVVYKAKGIVLCPSKWLEVLATGTGEIDPLFNGGMVAALSTKPELLYNGIAT